MGLTTFAILRARVRVPPSDGSRTLKTTSGTLLTSRDTPDPRGLLSLFYDVDDRFLFFLGLGALFEGYNTISSLFRLKKGGTPGVMTLLVGKILIWGILD